LSTATALDVTVRQPQASRTGSVRVPGEAAAAAEAAKVAKYAPWMAAKEHGRFIPLALETLGCFGQSFLSLLRECGMAAAERLRPGEVVGREDAPLTQFYIQRVAVALQRGLSHVVREQFFEADRQGALLSDDEEAYVRGGRAARVLDGYVGFLDASTVELEADY
jgi:hypothetical protein